MYLKPTKIKVYSSIFAGLVISLVLTRFSFYSKTLNQVSVLHSFFMNLAFTLLFAIPVALVYYVFHSYFERKV